MITPDGELARLQRRGFWLEYASMAITAGIIASSIALLGFGVDSVIELFSAGIVVWQLRGGVWRTRDPCRPAHQRDVLRARRLLRR